MKKIFISLFLIIFTSCSLNTEKKEIKTKNIKNKIEIQALSGKNLSTEKSTDKIIQQEEKESKEIENISEKIGAGEVLSIQKNDTKKTGSGEIQNVQENNIEKQKIIKNKISQKKKRKNQEPKAIILDKNKDGEFITIKYITKDKFIDLDSMKVRDFIGLKKTITGKLFRQDIEKIVVKYKNSEYYEDEGEYTLKKFNEGDNEFLYNAYKKYNSLNFGKNTYIFEAYAGGKVSKLELKVNLVKKSSALKVKNMIKRLGDSQILDKNKDGDYIKVRYLTKNQFISLDNLKLSDFAKLNKNITGEVYRKDVDKIVVKYENSNYYGNSRDYTLPKFKKGDENFSYSAYVQYKSLNFGTNIYTFKAYAGGEVSEIELEVSLKYKKIDSKYCLLDECIPVDAEISEKNGIFTGLIKVKEHSHGSYYLDRKKNFFKHTGTGEKEITIFKMGDVFVKNIIGTGFHSELGFQKIYDLNGKELENYDFGLKLKNIKIGNLDYKPFIIFNKKTDAGIGVYRVEYGISDNHNKKNYTLYNENDLINELNKKLSSGWKEVPKWFFVEYKKYPNLKIIYFDQSSYDGKAVRTVYLGKDKNYLEKNIKENGDFMDLTITNKIIGYYQKPKSIFEKKFYFPYDYNSSNNKYNSYEEINSVKKSYLPVFKMKKFDDYGHYLVYTIDEKIDYCNRNGMGKPAVYYYGDKEEKNKLKVILKPKDYFTKLVPDFNMKNGWEFSAKDGKIKVDNKEFDYLYYSSIAFDYERNKIGYVIYGRDIEKFLDDKLTKINFTKAEKNDFKDFWVEKFKKDSYYFVSFKYKDYLDKIIKLDFEKKPTKEFRVLLDTYELGKYKKEYEKTLYKDEKSDFLDNEIIRYFDRGKTSREVFEWGGTLFDLSGQVRVY